MLLYTVHRIVNEAHIYQLLHFELLNFEFLNWLRGLDKEGPYYCIKWP